MNKRTISNEHYNDRLRANALEKLIMDTTHAPDVDMADAPFLQEKLIEGLTDIRVADDLGVLHQALDGLSEEEQCEALKTHRAHHRSMISKG